MLAEITEFEETVTLVSDTGIQYMDFALKFDERKVRAGEFAFVSSDKHLLMRLLRNDEQDFLFYPPEPGKIQKVKSEFDISMKSSLDLLDGVWVPCPVFRFKPPHTFEQGPGNWARMRLIRLATPDIDGNTHRLTLAFDTRVMPYTDTSYLAPNTDDVSAGMSFRMVCHTWDMKWFLDEEWVSAWLKEIFTEANAHRQREDVEEELAELHYQAHYLNLLSLFSHALPEQQTQEQPQAEIPDIRIVANEANSKVIPVDLVLDVGNSRTCGILIEDHGQAGSGMRQNYVLQLRDLLTPEQVYQDPFESRIEFAQASFGKDHHSVKSGRHDAFQWPTIARVGKEAGRLASFRRGTEGSTGLSSPKRYLWDEQAYGHGWRFNSAYVKTDSEPFATAAPFSFIINDTGEALYAIEDEDERMPVFTPLYSRSSLMTFMLAEVLTQALCQINSPAQRSRQGHARTPRRLNSIILTVPPGMPLAERSILNERLKQAIGLVWKSMNWHSGDENPWDTENGVVPRIPMPKVRVEWDEASCGQLVYLYNEINRNFAGHPEALFATLARPDKTNRERITLATIDIGGGTTDLVITDYSLERNGGSSVGSNAYIQPEQRFRDGFKIAGDDIVLDVIQHYVLPGFTKALASAGVNAPDALMSRLCGGESLDARDQVLRQQLNLQVFTPLALAILKEYEQFLPEQPTELFQHSYRTLLGEDAVSDGVLEYVNSAIRRETNSNVIFDWLNTQISLDLQQLHQDFLSDKFNITKTLAALCEVVSYYPCDMLLLTGRPSRLPGVQAYIRQLLPVPTDRILPLQGYRTGGWYPFHKNGLIDDPKSTAAVGAMLCLLCANHSISNFHFVASALKPYSTIKHIGILDQENAISDADVLYRDIEIEAEGNKIKLPQGTDGQDSPELEMRGFMRLGFRQLTAARWAASPLYTLDFTSRGKKRFAQVTAELGPVPLKVRFKVVEPKTRGDDQNLISDRLVIDAVEAPGSSVSFSNKDLILSLNTMLDADGLGDSKYWLDSGSVKRS